MLKSQLYLNMKNQKKAIDNLMQFDVSSERSEIGALLFGFAFLLVSPPACPRNWRKVLLGVISMMIKMAPMPFHPAFALPAAAPVLSLAASAPFTSKSFQCP